MVIINAKNLNVLASTIKTRRKSLAMTQEQLSEKSEVSQSMLAQIESGKRLPGLIMMVNVLSALDMVLKVEIGK